MDKIKILICFSTLLILSLSTAAQNRDRNQSRPRRDFNREDFMAKRNVYLTEKMQLTAEETAVFIPMDNELLRKKFEAGRDCRRYDRELHEKKEKTEEEFKKLLQCKEEVKAMIDKLDKEYLEKFKKILSAEKILKYEKAEKEFIENYSQERR